MTRKVIYPSWLTECDLDCIRSMSSPKVGESLDECQLQLQRLSDNLDKFPEEMEFFSIKNYYPTEELLSYYTKEFDSVIHLCECWSYRWFCQHAYRMKGHFDFFKKSMESGNWTVACSLLRNIIEEIAHFDFYLGKISKEFDEISKIQKEDEVSENEGRHADPDLDRRFRSCHIEIIKIMSLAIFRTSIDWEEYMKRISHEYGIDFEKPDIEDEDMFDKVNILTAIDKMSARYKEKFREHYDILSEMVHPNFGANILVISSTDQLGEVYEALRMSSNIKTITGANLFFDVSSKIIASAFSVENHNLFRAQTVHELFREKYEKGSFIYKHGIIEK